MSREDLVERLDNVPWMSKEQELCFEASDEIQALRKEVDRWKNTAGRMYEALREAKNYYEDQCAL